MLAMLVQGKEEVQGETMNDDVTHCNGCQSMTHSVRKDRAHLTCEKCGHNKTLGDVLQDEERR